MWVKSPSTTKSSSLLNPSFCLSSRDKKNDLPSLGVFYSSNPHGNPNQVRERKVLLLNSLLVVKRRNTEFLFFREFDCTLIYLTSEQFPGRHLIPWIRSQGFLSLDLENRNMLFTVFSLFYSTIFCCWWTIEKKTYISLSHGAISTLKWWSSSH